MAAGGVVFRRKMALRHTPMEVVVEGAQYEQRDDRQEDNEGDHAQGCATKCVPDKHELSMPRMLTPMLHREVDGADREPTLHRVSVRHRPDRHRRAWAIPVVSPASRLWFRDARPVRPRHVPGGLYPAPLECRHSRSYTDGSVLAGVSLSS